VDNEECEQVPNFIQEMCVKRDNIKINLNNVRKSVLDVSSGL